jgi:signal transduction histidine kinase
MSAPEMLPVRRPAEVGGPARERTDAVAAPELIRYLTEDHDRIAKELNDVVVRRIYAAGLDLQAALSLIGQHRAVDKIQHAIAELDLAIGDIRDTVFDHHRWHRS